MRRPGWLLGGLACALCLASPARSFIPQAERVETATAEANKASGRTRPLQLELTLRVADREPIGTGVLVTHPTGLARLELQDAQGIVERHLLQGTDHSASRDGREVEGPRAFLPPLFLLQGDSAPTLRSAMTTFGLDVDAIGLAPCGEKVCYVVGDPARMPPLPPLTEAELAALATRRAEAGGDLPAIGEERLGLDDAAEDPVVGSETDGPVDGLSGEGERGEGSAGTRADGGAAAAIWIESESFEIVRLDSRDGVITELGPKAVFGDVQFPQWVMIREPDREPVRLDFLQVVPVNAPAAVFRRSWLLRSPAPEGEGVLADPIPFP